MVRQIRKSVKNANLDMLAKMVSDEYAALASGNLMNMIGSVTSVQNITSAQILVRQNLINIFAAILKLAEVKLVVDYMREDSFALI